MQGQATNGVGRLTAALPNSSGSGFDPPYDIPYSGFETELRRSYLRRGADYAAGGAALGADGVIPDAVGRARF
jgi:hypothetical protein